MAFFIKQTLNPSGYHGFTQKPPFFEGWYYKLVDRDENNRFAIIPGVYLSEEKDKQHCFVQVFNSEAEAVQYHRYPFDQFKASPDRFEILVGPNYFSAEKMILDMDDNLGQVSGTLTFEGRTPWPVRFFSPGAMGWFAWVPLMECYHGVVSMNHRIEGSLSFDGQAVDFSDGQGYIEKDWGKQFPSAWIWGQSNHFDPSDVSLMLSVAVIPWLGRAFGGFIIGFYHDGVLHRFATYNRSRIETLTVDDSRVSLVVRNRDHRLHMEASRAGGGLLQAPTHTEMDRRIIETLNATIRVRLENLSGEVLYAGTGRHAGLETVGDLSRLVSMVA